VFGWQVDEESVEALMHLVKQLQNAVVGEKLRKAKGQESETHVSLCKQTFTAHELD